MGAFLTIGGAGLETVRRDERRLHLRAHASACGGRDGVRGDRADLQAA